MPSHSSKKELLLGYCAVPSPQNVVPRSQDGQYSSSKFEMLIPPSSEKVIVMGMSCLDSEQVISGKFKGTLSIVSLIKDTVVFVSWMFMTISPGVESISSLIDSYGPLALLLL